MLRNRIADIVSLFSCLMTLFMFQAVQAADEVHPGQTVYQQRCASCHDDPEQSKARSFETLQQMMPAMVELALTEGQMKAQTAGLSSDEIRSVVAYLGGRSYVSIEWKKGMMCPKDRQQVNTDIQPTISTFGLGPKNHRRLSSEQSGLKTADFGNLKLDWVLAFPNVTMMRSQPAIVGNTLFITPVESQELYAFDISEPPCLKWIYSSDQQLRTSLTYGVLPTTNQAVLVFGDTQARIHMVDAKSGVGMWITSLKKFPESIITGTPQLVGDRVLASLSQYEILVGANPVHECCKAHGGIASLNASDGEVVWFTPTMPDAKPVRDRGDGQMIWGPSGGPVWTSPTIDEKRGVLYVGTGEANSEPAHKHTDAILAVDMKDGSIRWSFQADANDIYLAGCRRNNPSLNCPPEFSINRDIDFGASVVLAKRSDGSDILLAGQKSSVVWALDPNEKGKVIWRWSKGIGTANGGIHWGLAYDGKRVFAAISDPGRPRPGFDPMPGLYALEVDTGEMIWEYRTYPECEGRSRALPRCKFMYGFSAAPMVIDGAVVQGSLDGILRVFDANTGEVLFRYDTAQNYVGVNGVPGQGGAIDNASVVAANGSLYVSSGYGMFGQPAGNVLLSFRPVAP